MKQTFKKTKVIFVGPSDTLDLIESAGFERKEIIGYISKKKINTLPYKSIKYFGNEKFLKYKKLKKKYLIVNNIYKNSDRYKLFQLTKKNKKLKLVTTISKLSIKFSNVKIGLSSIIYPGSTISSNVKIGVGTIISYNCLIGHDVKIGSFCFISPGVKILGSVKIGNNCFIGSNVTLMPQIEIKNNVNINAGSVISKNINKNFSVINKINLKYFKLT